MLVMIDPVPYAAGLPKPHAKASHMSALIAYPVASAALMGVLVQMGLSPRNSPLITADGWNLHYIARRVWVAETLHNLVHARTIAYNNVPAPAILESWLLQLPGPHYAQFVESMCDALNTDGKALEDIETLAHICELFTDAFLDTVSNAIIEGDLVSV